MKQEIYNALKPLTNKLDYKQFNLQTGRSETTYRKLLHSKDFDDYKLLCKKSHRREYANRKRTR